MKIRGKGEEGGRKEGETHGVGEDTAGTPPDEFENLRTYEFTPL